MEMTIREFRKSAVAAIEGIYESAEAEAIVSRLLQDRLKMEPYRILAEGQMTIATESEVQLAQDLNRLKDGEPIQYVIGLAEFCGSRFKVSPACLIPRQETEELVEIVATDLDEAISQKRDSGTWNRKGCLSGDSGTREKQDGLEREDSGTLYKSYRPDNRITILDLCTGSGCIAWSLAKFFPEAHVFACDISNDALNLACRQKVKVDGAKPVFFLADILAEPPAGLPQFDIIVSNPPYVMESERAQMRRDTLEHEPALALFVSDNDPLKFYKAIGRWAQKMLKSSGCLYCEINEKLGPETADVFSSMGKVEIFKDLRDKDRFIKLTKTI